MTSTGGAAPGWYHASGDPDGTQRYWDGAQWVGDPQPVPRQPAAFASPPSGAAGVPGYGPPGYGAPPAGGSAPYGYVPFAPAVPYGAAAMRPAPIGRRLLAYLIDALPVIVGIGVIIAAAIAFGDSSAPITVFMGAALVVYAIWNYWWRRGRTGQSIGDARQGIKLVMNDTAHPVGFWRVFGRYFVIGVISNFTCGIVGLLDISWPLWDDRNQRLGDKMFSMTVVVA